jgi:hypothetical protein
MTDPVPFAIPTRFAADPDRVALVIPGMGYSPARPLLHFATAALLQHGWTVQELWWRVPDDLGRLPLAGRASWVAEQVGHAVDAEGGACRLLVGKSLGTFAAALAADRSLPAVWLTPLLTLAEVAEPLRRAAAPALLVGGTRDDLWDGQVAAGLPHEVLEIPAADHSLEMDGDVVGSAAVLGRVVAAVDGFIARV